MYERELIGLSESGARYLVIGAVAIGLSGYPRATLDLDIMPDLSSKNLEKIIVTLTNLGYKPKLPVKVEELKDPKKRERWYKEKNMKVFSFFNSQYTLNSIDLMIYSPLDFKKCFERRQIINLDGSDIYVASIDDLLKLKRKAMRQKDLIDIRALELLKKKIKK